MRCEVSFALLGMTAGTRRRGEKEEEERFTIVSESGLLEGGDKVWGDTVKLKACF